MRNFIALIALFFVLACSNSRLQKTIVNLENQWDTIRPLANPDKGWYHHMLDNGVHKYLIQDDNELLRFPGMDHLYLRLCWAFLEPEEGKFNWAVIDTIIDKYVPIGYGISFRISCKETGGVPGSVPQEIDGVKYATPYWVKQAGAKGIDCPEFGNCSWTPDWNDPVFLEKLDNFHKVFAEKYDGKPWVRYVDVGSIGEWGEGHTHFSTRISPTVEEIKTHIDLYLRHYKKAQIVVADDLLYWNKPEEDVNELFEYVKSKNITFRDDSPLVNWYVENHLDKWTVTHPQFFEAAYKKFPTVFELEHYSAVKQNNNWVGKNGEEKLDKADVTGARIFREAIKLIHPTYIGFHGYIGEWHADNPDLTNELLNRCGYWYFVRDVTLPEKANAGSEQNIAITWENKGVAPSYNPYQLHFKFTDGKNEQLVVINNSGNTDWMDGENKKEVYQVNIPKGLPSGNYDVKIKLYDPTTERDVDLALKESLKDSEGFFKLATIRIN